MSRSPLIIVSGPSGVGKTTVIQRLLADASLPLRLSVSATTRKPRAGEVDGQHYHFWDRDRFEAGIAAGQFLEYAQVHGNYYGTLRDEVERHRDCQTGVILDIDVQGFFQVRQHCDDYLSIFLYVPEDRYEARLRNRASEDEAAIQRRLQTARWEITQAGEYMVQLVNEDLDETVSRVQQLIRDQYQRRGGSCSTI
ncbi:guanylate kinase [Tuwongella immobilis]|uniref:Guanylate kinase n=1 Tax=Tuwongella immobilis TaxID=692036 RepID=A0A6C2YT12_9BACT|nr:guanylate kinase [Tuwongella immobilis]VIP04179.1 guanylate kinase : Guanylate kinase OS=Eggerthella sp. CAG:368 GN=gmk PE=3 SV=1: Guanylate_kin [Tuwongella immobilis]VTS05722.1 guanylate kinase : Guanylate kinase OS=Eggerthella sp. CAG:368 GN=gmk PE=3 SV=1: Guanylate_kin [Tuwongella immobilis]